MLANQTANTARLYIYDGLANLMSDTAARRTGVISNLGTIEHLASTHVAAHDGVAYITTFGQTWIRSVTITGSSTGDFNATRLFYSPGANSWPVDDVRGAGIADGPNGIWIQRVPPPAANTSADTLYEWTGGSSEATPTGNTLRMHAGPDDVAINFDLGFGWSTSDQRIFLGQVSASGSVGRRITPAQITFTNVTDVTSIGDKLYAINTSGIIREYPNELDAAGPAAGWLRHGRLSLPKPTAWNRHGPITIMHDGMGWLRHGPYASAAKQGWLRRRDITMAAIRQGWRRWQSISSGLKTGWNRFGAYSSGLPSGWLRHRSYASHLAGTVAWRLRPGAPEPARAISLRFTDALAADQAVGSRKLYAIVSGDTIALFEGDGLNPVATHVRNFTRPAEFENPCLAVDGDSMFGCYTVNGDLVLSEYAISETTSALTLRWSTHTGFTARIGRGRAFGLYVAKHGDLYRFVVVYLDSQLNVYRYAAARSRFARRAGSPPGFTYRIGGILNVPATPRSLTAVWKELDDPITFYVGGDNGTITGYENNTRRPDLDASVPIGARNVTGLTIDSEGIMYAMARHPGDVYSLVFRPPPPGGFGWLRRRAIAMSPASWGWLRRRAIAMASAKRGWLRHGRVAFPKPMAWNRHGLITIMYDSMGWLRHGPYESAAKHGWLRRRAISMSPARWGWLRRRTIAMASARQGWLRHGRFSSGLRHGWFRMRPFAAGLRTGWIRWQQFASGLRTGWWRHGRSRAPRLGLRLNAAGIRKRYLRI